MERAEPDVDFPLTTERLVRLFDLVFQGPPVPEVDVTFDPDDYPVLNGLPEDDTDG